MQTGDPTSSIGVIAAPPRAKAHWTMLGAIALLVCCAAGVVVLKRAMIVPPVRDCPLPQVRAVNREWLAWANDSRTAIGVTSGSWLALIGVPELKVTGLPYSFAFSEGVGITPDGRPVEAVIQFPRTPGRWSRLTMQQPSQHSVLRLSRDGLRWDRLLTGNGSFAIAPDGRRAAAIMDRELRIWSLTDARLEYRVETPTNLSPRFARAFWEDSETLFIPDGLRDALQYRLGATGFMHEEWHQLHPSSQGFRVVRRHPLSDSLRGWLWTHHCPGVPAPFEDWDLQVTDKSGRLIDSVSLGRRAADPKQPQMAPMLGMLPPRAAIPSPDGQYAFVCAADRTVRLWTRPERPR